MTALHSIGQFIRDALQAIPLGVVRVAIVIGLSLLLLWIVRLPKSETTEEGQGGKGIDLRWGAALALLIQIAIYALV
jgi:hypothetical protein